MAQKTPSSPSNPDDLFASPDTNPQASRTSTSKPPVTPAPANNFPNPSSPASRESALRAELSHLRNINSTLSTVISSLAGAQSHMQTINNTVNTSTTLLETWTRILSQTEHNQRLILNPNWQGAGQDVRDAELEVERREDEEKKKEEQRRKEDRRRAEEAERKTEGQAAGASTGGRGTGTGRRRTGRGVGVGGTGRGISRGGGTAPGRGGTGIGRGTGVGRGRGRGVS